MDEHTVAGFISYFVIFFGIFIVVWVVQYMILKRRISSLKAKIEEDNK
jgi:uncharacterized membrane protein YjfL (UPF0719 family)